MGEKIKILKYETEHIPDFPKVTGGGVHRLSALIPRGVMPVIDQISAVHGFQQCGAAEKR